MSEDTRAWKDQYMLRLPDGMREQIKTAAAANKRSMNAEIVARLADHDSHRNTVLSFRNEMNRMRAERDRAEMELKAGAPAALEDALRRALPEGLFGRIASAAAANDRPLEEEVIQSLEASFPPFDLGTLLTRVSFLLSQSKSTAERNQIVADANVELEKNSSEWRLRKGSGGSVTIVPTKEANEQ